MQITEAVGTLTATPAEKGGRRWRARLIESDAKGKQGSSGYYPREVLERDGPATFASKPVYFDHPTETERYDRPERSVRDLAGKIDSTPVMEADGLYADIEFYSWAAPIVAEMAGDIGMSIRASANAEASTDKSVRGPVITSLFDGKSVDLVTKAGAGGKLVSLLESARGPVSEATSNDVREELERVVRAEHGTDEDRWIYVRDFDESTVWFSIDSGDESAIWQQAYTLTDDGAATLTGDRVEVRVRTDYVPVTADAAEAVRQVKEARNVGQWVESRIHRDFTVMADDMAADGRLTREERIGLSSAIGDALAAFVASLEAGQPQLYQRDPWEQPPPAGVTSEFATEADTPKPPVTPAGSTKETHESEEDTMQQIEESRLAQLEADAGRVQTLESERDAATAERDTERAAHAATRNRAAAIEAIADSGHDFTALERRGLLADIPVVAESGEFDAEAFTTALTEAAADSRSAGVTGFGSTTDTSTNYVAEADTAVANAFGRTTKEA